MSRFTKQLLTSVVALGLITPIATQAVSNNPQITVNAKYRHRRHTVHHRSMKHIRRGKHYVKRIKRHHKISFSNSSLDNPNWYIHNANYVNNLLLKMGNNPYNDLYDYDGIISREDFATSAYNIRSDVPLYHLGIVIGQLYGYNPVMNTHIRHALSPRRLKSHKSDIVRAINNWKAIYQLVRKYPHADELSASKYDEDGETGDEIATCITHDYGGKNIVYVNGHKMTRHDKNRITQTLENNNAYNDREFAAIDPND